MKRNFNFTYVEYFSWKNNYIHVSLCRRIFLNREKIALMWKDCIFSYMRPSVAKFIIWKHRTLVNWKNVPFYIAEKKLLNENILNKPFRLKSVSNRFIFKKATLLFFSLHHRNEWKNFNSLFIACNNDVWNNNLMLNSI